MTICHNIAGILLDFRGRSQLVVKNYNGNPGGAGCNLTRSWSSLVGGQAGTAAAGEQGGGGGRWKSTVLPDVPDDLMVNTYS